MITIIGLWLVVACTKDLALNIYYGEDKLIDYVIGLPMIFAGFWMVL